MPARATPIDRLVAERGARRGHGNLLDAIDVRLADAATAAGLDVRSPG